MQAGATLRSAGILLTAALIGLFGAVDATTGDYAGITPDVLADGTFTVKGLNTQDVWPYFTVDGNLVR